MAIEPRKHGDNYDENASRISSMSQVLKNYQEDFDHIKSAEMNYERMRTLNKTTLLQVDLQKSAGNILASLSVDTIWNSPGDSAVTAALAEARASILSRAVGPLEGLPVGDYIQDSVRAQNVISHTMVGPEQRLISKLSQMRGNRLTPQNSLGGEAQSYSTIDENGSITEFTIPEPGRALPDEESAARRNAIYYKKKHSIVNNVDGSTKDIFNFYNQDVEYGASWAEEYNDNFNFSITNRATGVRKAFPAHILNLNEAVSTSWNNISLINRSEDLYIYQRAERSFNLEFFIFASTLDGVNEIVDGANFPNTITISGEEVGLMSKKMMWDRINFLHSLTRPTYTSEGKYDKAPYCSLFLADLFRGITAVFDSININYDPMIWDMNIDAIDGIKPMIAQVTLSGKFLHSTAPSAWHEFYGRTTK